MVICRRVSKPDRIRGNRDEEEKGGFGPRLRQYLACPSVTVNGIPRGACINVSKGVAAASLADGSAAAVFGPRLVYLRLPEASGLGIFTEARRRGQRVEKGLAGPHRRLSRCPQTSWNLQRPASGRRRAATCAGLLGLLVAKARSRLTFCPQASIKASEFTFSNRLSLNLLKPCHSFASPKSGSTHTARLLRALR